MLLPFAGWNKETAQPQLLLIQSNPSPALLEPNILLSRTLCCGSRQLLPLDVQTLQTAVQTNHPSDLPGKELIPLFFIGGRW